MKKVILLSLVFFCSLIVKSQDMRNNAYVSLFSDKKASRIGDAITIYVMEFSEATNKAQTVTGRTSNQGLDVSTGTPPGTNMNFGFHNQFKGDGRTSRTGMIKTKISATIDSVLANGNLMIKGSRKIVVNGEEQTIFIKGIVRTSDIAPDNSVLSYNISEAEIRIQGQGPVSDVQSPGLFAKILNFLF